MLTRLKTKYIGDRAFYSYVIRLVIPMILQGLITNFVSLLDNIMVGQIGTAPMSGVAISNQLFFVFNISIFGAVSGPSIFGAQFYGKGDHEGQKYTFRFRIFTTLLITTIAIGVLYFFDDQLISLYLTDTTNPENVAVTLDFAKQYLSVMLIGLLPFALGQAYSSVIRECGETVIPMIGSLSAVGINLILDYGLIFGKLGLPQMGVAGAAWATVIAKTIEALVVIIWAHARPKRNRYLIGAYRGFKIPWHLFKTITIKSLPLLINEFLWAAGVATIAQCYARRGLDVVAANNIAGTMTNLFSVIYIQLGSCISIIVGQKLGAGLLKEAKDMDNKLTFFCVAACAVVSIIMLPIAQIFPYLYKTEPEIRSLASYLITIMALVMPLWSFAHCAYFTLRSGGKTWVTFLFDSVYSWGFTIPIAAAIAFLTDMPIRPFYFIVSFSEIVKTIIGYFMVKSDVWLKNIVNDNK